MPLGVQPLWATGSADGGTTRCTGHNSADESAPHCTARSRCGNTQCTDCRSAAFEIGTHPKLVQTSAILLIAINKRSSRHARTLEISTHLAQIAGWSSKDARRFIRKHREQTNNLERYAQAGELRGGGGRGVGERRQAVQRASRRRRRHQAGCVLLRPA